MEKSTFDPNNKFRPESINETDNRTGDYDDANDRSTFMTDLEKVQNKLENHGYTEQFRVEENKIVGITSKKKYKQKDIKVVNFYRFEGITNPDDMSILYAIETCDGSKGTLTDGYGPNSDEATGEFMKQVEIHKQTNGMSGLDNII